jgi:hypothetical protein
MRVVGWITTGLVVGILIGVAVAGAASAGDVKRYVRMRRM